MARSNNLAKESIGLWSSSSSSLLPVSLLQKVVLVVAVVLVVGLLQLLRADDAHAAVHIT